MDKIPQYSDLDIVFTDLSYNTSDEIDLSSVDNIILSIASSNSLSSPDLILSKSLNASSFTVDNAAKSVTVSITASQLDNKYGKFYINLWIVDDGKYLTHLTKTFEIDRTVKYEA